MITVPMTIQSLVNDIPVNLAAGANAIPLVASVDFDLREPEYEGTYEVTPTEETQTLETDGLMMTDDITVNPIPSQYIIPSGEKNITVVENGDISENVTEYSRVNVHTAVPLPSGIKDISIDSNGTHLEDVTDYEVARIAVAVPLPSGTKDISINSNGVHTEDVEDYVNARITVDVPLPEGTKDISVTQNGVQTEDVEDYVNARLTVNVPPPAGYANVTGVTAQAEDVKSGKTIVGANGQPVNGSYIWSFLGDDAEFMEKVCDQEIALEDTSFPTWAASTTAAAILATANVKTFVADMMNYEYLIRWRVRFDAAYNDGATLKAIPYKELIEAYQAIFRRPNSLATIASDSFVGNSCVTLYTAPLNVYYNTNGALAYTFSVSYGIYGAVAAATFSSSTAASPTVTIKRPTLNARCSSTYFATGRKSEIDTENSKFHIVGELYRVKVGSALRKIYEGLVDLYNEE